MTKQTNAKTAPKTAAADKAKAPKVTLLAIAPDTMRAAVLKCVAAEVSLQRAAASLLTSYADAVKGLKCKSMSAVQFDRQFRPSFAAELEAKVKRGTLKASSAKVAESRAKTLVLALANGIVPIIGETVHEYRERASEALKTRKLPDGSSVWEQASKRGPKVGSGKAKPSAPHGPSKDDAGETGLDIRPALAAALILTGQNAERAQRLCVVMQSYADEFDRWTATILTDKDKAELTAKTAPVDASKLAALGKVTTRKAAA